jgi:hypothetical protein
MPRGVADYRAFHHLPSHLQIFPVNKPSLYENFARSSAIFCSRSAILLRFSFSGLRGVAPKEAGDGYTTHNSL